MGEAGAPPPGRDPRYWPPIDWAQAARDSERYQKEKWLGYPPIVRDFYREDPAVAALTPRQVSELRRASNNIIVELFDSGTEAGGGPGATTHIPNPVRTFEEAFQHFPDILREIRRAGFERPSPIQMQAWPIALRGLDLIGIAQTGQGSSLIEPAVSCWTAHGIVPIAGWTVA